MILQLPIITDLVFFVGHILFAKLDGHSLGCWPCFQFYKLEGETFVEKQWFDPLFPAPFYCTPCPPGV